MFCLVPWIFWIFIFYDFYYFIWVGHHNLIRCVDVMENSCDFMLFTVKIPTYLVKRHWLSRFFINGLFKVTVVSRLCPFIHSFNHFAGELCQQIVFHSLHCLSYDGLHCFRAWSWRSWCVGPAGTMESDVVGASSFCYLVLNETVFGIAKQTTLKIWQVVSVLKCDEIILWWNSCSYLVLKIPVDPKLLSQSEHIASLFLSSLMKEILQL